ncbi:phosphatidylcholine/phosphatidylserine synthase [Rhodospirillaceae bacterium]|nr:phosphatidylcholine/phosphatidylserine synthase [Rhodospirillaceae bacterium]MBT7731697.1 phosphatidylcholine/phosphatidylserine synthase [Rhodospirillaceae bacterium]MDC0998451.1 phosphatidylcholine/phosphatidylserine synthase [Alphaproteobacteria bacterium]MDC1441425.1 phosphatidylcholine/phosphatidylserine synthase [Rhodospirillaceae bacterium]
MDKVPRRSRIKMMPISIIIPNLITVMALCSGLTGIRFALQERWEFAIGAIALAAILDTLDGRMARLLKGQSKFGAELDSLSDFISFGVAPALILFFWTTQSIQGIGWATVLFFSTCMALRLARFNTQLEDPNPPSFSARFFSGVPAPAAAGLACLPVIVSFELDLDVIKQPYLISGWLVFIGLMMVSSIPTFSFKGSKLPRKLVIPLFVIAGLFIACVLTETWIALAMLIMAYFFSIPLSFFSYRKLNLREQIGALEE